MKKITIKDIADEAGVGTTTVSRVLNGKSKVKDETREKILAIIQKHNFKPSTAARSLVRNVHQDKLLGVVIPKMASQFIFEVLNSLYRQISEKEFNILIFNVEKGREDIVSRIPQENLSGILLFGDPSLNAKEKKLIIDTNIPYVYIDHYEDNEHFVCYDNNAGGAMAAEYLIAQGRRRITFFGLTPHTSQQHNDRLNAFRERLLIAGISAVQEVYIPDEYAAYDMALTLMKSELTDGIFFFSDQMAYGGMRAKNELRADVSLIGYDDIFPTSFMQLSTIRQSADELVSRGLSVLTDLINSPVPFYLRDSIHYILRPELVDRGS